MTDHVCINDLNGKYIIFNALYIKSLQLGYVSCSCSSGGYEIMFRRKYILTTYRLLVTKWWLSLIKLTSLTLGTISFLLVWLFYVDHQVPENLTLAFFQSCTTENVLLLTSIQLITIVTYFFIMRSQMTLRYKEFFIRRYYGENGLGIILILLIETFTFIGMALLISLVLIDQVAPFFNWLTQKEVDTRQAGIYSRFLPVVSFLTLLGFVVGLLPAIICARKRAIDLLNKLPAKHR
jgi:hypothetical protein